MALHVSLAAKEDGRLDLDTTTPDPAARRLEPCGEKLSGGAREAVGLGRCYEMGVANQTSHVFAEQVAEWPL